MAGKRKAPKLRIDGSYYTSKIYTPKGNRTTISFGHVNDRPEPEVYAIFAKWIDLYQKQPQKMLSFESPYEAVEQVINPTTFTTVEDFLERYLQWASENEKGSRASKAVDIYRINRIKRFLEPYHDWPVNDFGPDELKKVQKALSQYKYKTGDKEKKYTRGAINDTIKYIRKIWRWGLGRRVVSYEVVQSLEEVRPVRLGQGEVYDKPKRARVTYDEFFKVSGAVNATISDMLQLIWHTAMRPYEVCEMRPYDILIEDEECWLYIPGRDITPYGKHKTTHMERVKVIPLTRKSQDILKRRITNYDSKDYIFSPKVAVDEILEEKHQGRKTPLKYGNRPGTNKREHPMIKPGEKYSPSALRIACKRGCMRAEVEVFTPYDLRRSVATETRASLGKEAAKVLLGHTKTDTTDIYLLDEVKEAVKVAKLLAKINGE